MEMTRLNIIYDLLQASKSLENNKVQEVRRIYLVICNSCYWCASYFGVDDSESLSAPSSHIFECRVCNSHNTELLPISTNESFKIEYSPTRGIAIEFL
jgi:hypothetical protein